jgi:transforming growth factor-beta-induced protein
MKKLPISLLAILALFAVTFVACDEEDDGLDLAPPIFTSDPDDQAIEVGETVVLTFDAETPGGYQASSVANSDNSVATAEITSEPSNSTSSSGTFEVTVTGVAAGETTITLTVTDNQAQSASNDVVIDVEETIPDIPTLGDTIPDFEDLSTLAAALEATDLDEALNEEGPFTVFAPNNAAFDALLDALEFESLDEVVANLTSDGVSQLLQAHVVQDSLPADLIQAQDYTTINDSTITITTDADGNVFANGAQVVTANIIAGNGVIHVIDSVINLPGLDMGDEMANAGSALGDIEELSTLNAAVDATGLTDDLDQAEQVTIFAPNNAAFQALLDELELASLDELVEALTAEGVTGVLQAHVVADSLGAAEVVAAAGGDSLATLNADEMIGVTTDADGNVYVNGAQVIETDILVGNGVIHIIDSVINLPEMGMANAGSALGDIEELSTLNAAVDATGLTDDLDQAEQVTIFAPNNAAFQALLDDVQVTTLEELVEALTAEGVAGVLQAHVVADSLGAAEVLAATDSLTTLNADKKLGVRTEGDMVFVNDAQVLETDILVGNGVIHVIDSVVNRP